MTKILVSDKEITPDRANELHEKNGHTIEEYNELLDRVNRSLRSPNRSLGAAKPLHHFIGVSNTATESEKQQQAKEHEVNKQNEEAQKRLEFLNSHTWDELDKMGLLQELKDKSFALFRQKYVLKFGKEPKGYEATKTKHEVSENDIAKLEHLLINDKHFTGEQLQRQRQGFKEAADWYAWLKKQAAMKAEEDTHKDWDTLDREGKLPWLKDMHNDIFKRKYREKFGKESPYK